METIERYVYIVLLVSAFVWVARAEHRAGYHEGENAAYKWFATDGLDGTPYTPKIQPKGARKW